MAHVIIVGAGAIGSHVVPHVARMTGVSAVSVIDRDCYDASNGRSQDIRRADVGKPKAEVQARRLRQLNPSIVATAVHRAVEDLPLGWLRGDVILACLDSRRARIDVNQAAWRLGVPWINAGVDAAGLLARVQVFVPAPDAPCLECAWDARDYELVEQAYPCQGAAAAAPTAAPSALAALAASLQAIECEKVLTGRHDEWLAGRDVMIDARHHRHYVTAFRRNPACRMPDHAGWSIEPLVLNPRSTTFDQLLGLASTLAGTDVRLSVAGHPWAVSLVCDACGFRTPQGLVNPRRSTEALARCAQCGGPRRATGFDLRDTASPEEFPVEMRRAPVTRTGLLDGDVLSFGVGESRLHYELSFRRGAGLAAQSTGGAA